MKQSCLEAHTDENGQTLIAIIALGVIALMLGVTISTRFIQSSRSQVRLDESTKAMGMADLGIERFLLIPNSTLEDYITYGSCGTECDFTITDDNGQELTAHINLSFAGNTQDPFEVRINIGEVHQLSMTGYPTNDPLDVCWNGDAAIYANYIYEESGEIKSDAYAYNSISNPVSNGFDNSASDHGFSSCFEITARGVPKYLRIKPFESDVYINLIPDPGNNIPKQGILIESVGQAGDTVKKVTVLKSDPIAPDFFDYVLYQRATDNPLSNMLN